jgi:hypothetical protein
MEISENPLVRWISNIRDHGLEYASRRFYSLYSGKVDDNADTTFQGRIKAKIGALGIGTKLPNGTFEPSVLSRTALPSSIYAGKDHGVYFPPEIGDNVWMSFDHGDPTRPNPHYAGSYWSNTNPALASVGSDLPAEFRTTYAGGAQVGPTGKVVLKLGSPLNRGIKTRFGHGLIFSDDETAPYVALWSGQQVSAGQEAIRRQELKLSDDPAEPGIFARTFYGHKISLNDQDQSITITGLSPDPTGLLANSIKIEDLTGKITIRTKLQQVVTIDDATLSTSVVTPGQVAVTAGGACSITAASIAMASGAGGPATETGAGSKVSNFIGDITETVGGAFTQNVIGIMNLTAASLNLTAVLINFLGVVVIGPAVTARPLANDYLVDFVLNHVHPTAVPGPPSIATPGPISTIVTPGLPLPPITLLQYATSMLRAT